MLATRVVDNLQEFTPALLDIAELKRTTEPALATPERLAADLRQLGVLPRFEKTRMGHVIPVNSLSLNISARTYTDYNIMDIHSAIRRRLDNGLWALEHISDNTSQLTLQEKIRAGRLIKQFAGFAIVRATQLSPDLWRRTGGNSKSDGEGRFIAAHKESYETLRPLMTRRFRGLVDNAIAKHAYRAHGYSSGVASERLR